MTTYFDVLDGKPLKIADGYAEYEEQVFWKSELGFGIVKLNSSHLRNAIEFPHLYFKKDPTPKETFWKQYLDN